MSNGNRFDLNNILQYAKQDNTQNQDKFFDNVNSLIETFAKVDASKQAIASNTVDKYTKLGAGITTISDFNSFNEGIDTEIKRYDSGRDKDHVYFSRLNQIKTQVGTKWRDHEDGIGMLQDMYSKMIDYTDPTLSLQFSEGKLGRYDQPYSIREGSIVGNTTLFEWREMNDNVAAIASKLMTMSKNKSGKMTPSFLNINTHNADGSPRVVQVKTRDGKPKDIKVKDLQTLFMDYQGNVADGLNAFITGNAINEEEMFHFFFNPDGLNDDLIRKKGAFYEKQYNKAYSQFNTLTNASNKYTNQLVELIAEQNESGTPITNDALVKKFGLDLLNAANFDTSLLEGSNMSLLDNIKHDSDIIITELAKLKEDGVALDFNNLNDESLTLIGHNLNMKKIVNQQLSSEREKMDRNALSFYQFTGNQLQDAGLFSRENAPVSAEYQFLDSWYKQGLNQKTLPSNVVKVLENNDLKNMFSLGTTKIPESINDSTWNTPFGIELRNALMWNYKNDNNPESSTYNQLVQRPANITGVAKDSEGNIIFNVPEEPIVTDIDLDRNPDTGPFQFNYNTWAKNYFDLYGVEIHKDTNIGNQVDFASRKLINKDSDNPQGINMWMAYDTPNYKKFIEMSDDSLIANSLNKTDTRKIIQTINNKEGLSDEHKRQLKAIMLSESGGDMNALNYNLTQDDIELKIKKDKEDALDPNKRKFIVKTAGWTYEGDDKFEATVEGSEFHLPEYKLMDNEELYEELVSKYSNIFPQNKLKMLAQIDKGHLDGLSLQEVLEAASNYKSGAQQQNMLKSLNVVFDSMLAQNKITQDAKLRNPNVTFLQDKGDFTRWHELNDVIKDNLKGIVDIAKRDKEYNISSAKIAGMPLESEMGNWLKAYFQSKFRSGGQAGWDFDSPSNKKTRKNMPNQAKYFNSLIASAKRTLRMKDKEGEKAISESKKALFDIAKQYDELQILDVVALYQEWSKRDSIIPPEQHEHMNFEDFVSIAIRGYKKKPNTFDDEEYKRYVQRAFTRDYK